MFEPAHIQYACVLFGVEQLQHEVHDALLYHLVAVLLLSVYGLILHIPNPCAHLIHSNQTNSDELIRIN